MNLSKDLEIAIRAAKEAGEIVDKYFEETFEASFKEDGSIVTKADKEAEDRIIEIIKSEFPEDGFHGEETGISSESAERVWFVDPIDGTTNFANGLPIFAVSIALQSSGQIIVSVIYNPVTNSLYYAENGKGAFYNEKKIKVSDNPSQAAILTTGNSREDEDKTKEREIRNTVNDHIKIYRRLGCASMELAYVARGSTEGFISLGLKPYDYAAGVLIVKEAGGKITDFSGNDWEFENGHFVATNGVIHDDVLKLV